MKLSVVIRAKNEEKWLGKVLERLESQTEKNFEVILVNDNSTDKTVDIFNSSNLNKRIINIEKGKFDYVYAANLGAKEARADFVMYLSGHSVPLYENMIEASLKFFEDKNVAGVYGPCFSNENAGWAEKVIYGSNVHKRKTAIIKSSRMGLLGLTNAVIRKDLWDNYPFNKQFSKGGEDTQWAGYYLKKGFYFILEPKMSVYHSHGITFPKFIKQYLHWLYVWLKGLVYNLIYKF